MTKVLFINSFISLLILASCNNSKKVEKTNNSPINLYQEEVKDTSNNKKEPNYLELSKDFVMQTQNELAKNLVNKLNTKGTEYALIFCSVKAYPLTDSMAKSLDIKIKRVSDRNRNPYNKPNIQEAEYITKSKKLLSKGETIKPEITETDKKVVGYYPIMTNNMCLQCHGKPKTEVLSETLSQIKKIYPDDKAMGYNINELRGIWVVEMNKK